MNIVQSGDEIFLVQDMPKISKLAKGNYLLKFDPNKGGFYLKKKEDFILPAKIYGDNSIIKRYLNSYKNTTRNLGVLLSGLKGAGKTVLCQELCVASELPVIIISQGYSGTAFVDFITAPEWGDCIIFIDEFEKVYNDRNEEGEPTSPSDLLQIMDGGYPTHYLYLLTCNEMRISEFLVNRPGRIRYRKHYNNLSKEVIDEVIADSLKNKKHAKSVHNFLNKLGIKTFDLLTAIIKDMNLYGEDANECGQHFNLDAEKNSYTVHELYEGKKIPFEDAYLSLKDSQNIAFYAKSDPDDEVNWDDKKAKKPKYPKPYGTSIGVNMRQCKMDFTDDGVIVHSRGRQFLLEPSRYSSLVF